MTVSTARPTMSAAAVPAARQMPLLSCWRSSAGFSASTHATAGPNTFSVIFTNSGASRKKPNMIPGRPRMKWSTNRAHRLVASGSLAPKRAAMRSIGPNRRNGSIAISRIPATAAHAGARPDVGLAWGLMASSGLTRVAHHAGSAAATSAARIEPTDPNHTPPQLTATPAVNSSSNRSVSSFTHRSPSGTPTATPATASSMPSTMTSFAICDRYAPTARIIASVRCRSETPIDSDEKTMNVAASMDTVPPR
jgi:hypothetical protein